MKMDDLAKEFTEGERVTTQRRHQGQNKNFHTNATIEETELVSACTDLE